MIAENQRHFDMKGFTIFILATFLGGVSFAQSSSLLLGFDSSGAPLIVQSNVELKSQTVQRFSRGIDALAAMKVMQQMVFEDSLRVEQLRFEIAVKSNQIKSIIQELERLQKSPQMQKGQIKKRSPELARDD